jgi:PiT family inorganic phosphate transporter
MGGDALLVTVVLVALVFDFTNGFHDTANSVATSVSTRALSPRAAVLISAICNFAGAFVSTAVATAVGKGIVDITVITNSLILAALLGAIGWNLLTWWLGLPSSSSHALIGGLIGAALVKAGFDAVEWNSILHTVIEPAIAAPVLGFAIGFALMVLVYWTFQRARPAQVTRGFRLAQLASGSFVAFAHGANDAQKTMGVIAAALFASHRIDHFYVPTWVKLAAGTAIALGTYSGGWRIMRTVGSRVFKLEPPHGFAAQTTAAGVLYATTHLGYPISTTQVVSGSVMGVGATRRLSAVRWGVAGDIVLAWVVTIPAAAAVAAAAYWLIAAI